MTIDLTQPLPFQRRALEQMEKFNGRVLLADDMGLGKTFQFIRFVHDHDLFPAIVVCPASVKFNWEVEIHTHINMRCEILWGRKGRRPGQTLNRRPPPFTIINYEILEGWLDYLCSLRALIVGIDESHYLGNRRSKRSRLVKTLCQRAGPSGARSRGSQGRQRAPGTPSKRAQRGAEPGERCLVLPEPKKERLARPRRPAGPTGGRPSPGSPPPSPGLGDLPAQGLPGPRPVPHVIAMTGTPWENRPSELFVTLSIVAPSEFPSWYQYAERYCGPRFMYGRRTYTGASRLSELKSRLFSTCMIRRSKIDVLDELPSKRRTVVPLEMHDHKEYERLERQFHSWVATHSVYKTRSAKRLAKFGELKRVAAQLKMKRAMEWIENFLATGQKLVVFGIHRSVLEPIRERWKNESVLITGKVTGRKRQRAVEAFVNDDSVRLVVGNIKAAGVGINGLQKVCSTAAFVELAWNASSHHQSEDRLWRIGQCRGVQIYYLVARNTIEHRVASLIQNKDAWFNTVFNDNGQSQDVSFNLLDMIEKEVLDGNVERQRRLFS